MPKTVPKKAAPEPPKVYGESELDYEAYLKVRELLQLQKPLSSPPHHDEYLFIIIHQAFELWFRLLVHELEAALRSFQASNLPRVAYSLRRCVAILKLFVPQIHLLETMTPVEFLKFRDHLKPASGFQSVQFREVEFLVGLKDEAYLRFFQRNPEQHRRLAQRLKGPDLGMAFVAYLAQQGLDVPADAKSADLRAEGPVRDAVAKALLPIYGDPVRHDALYQVCELLLTLDEWLALWRQHHVNVVERIIGAKTGTGGSSGVTYLRTTTSKRSFPYLWDLRTSLEVPR